MIRKGTKNDISDAMDLILELAEFEKGLDKVTNTKEQMEIDGFGENPIFYFYVAEEAGMIVGLALYYFRYSTWKGKQLYLEDIVVTKNKRGKGYGKELFDKIIEVSAEEQCNGIMWQVLNWNKDAIEFYKKNGAEFGPEWLNCYLYPRG